MSYGIRFDFEAWLRSLVELVFWLMLLLPMIIFPVMFLTLPPAFEAAGIQLTSPSAFQAVNVFLVAMIDPVKGAPVMGAIMREVAAPIGLPPLLIAVVFILVFFWENETNKVTISKFAPIRAMKEVVVGDKNRAGILLLIPIFENIKIAPILGPVFESLEKLKHKVFRSTPSTTAKTTAH